MLWIISCIFFPFIQFLLMCTSAFATLFFCFLFQQLALCRVNITLWDAQTKDIIVEFVQNLKLALSFSLDYNCSRVYAIGFIGVKRKLCYCMHY